MNPTKPRHSFRPLLVASAVPLESGPPSSGVAPTVPMAKQPQKRAGESHVRLRGLAPSLPRSTDLAFLDAQELLDELAEDQLMLSMNIACFEDTLAAAPPDPSAHAAVTTVQARLDDLGALRDALAGVLDASIDPRLQRNLVPDSPLADYLRGLYAWAHAVLRALDELTVSVRALQPDWALLRWRLDEAKNFHFDELLDVIRADLETLAVVAHGGAFGAHPPPVTAQAVAVETLFYTAELLEDRLDRRFG